MISDFVYSACFNFCVDTVDFVYGLLYSSDDELLLDDVKPDFRV